MNDIVASRSLRQTFVERLAQLGAPYAIACDTTTNYANDAISQLEPALARIGLSHPAEAANELRRAVDALAVTGDPSQPAAMVPGDTCPDNNVDRTEGMVLFDFEGAQYRHVAWEMAYLTVPWPTCWCSWAIPAHVARHAIALWRRLLAPTFPCVANPSFEIDLARATMVWAAQWVGHSLAPAIDGVERPRFHEDLAPSDRATVPASLRILAEDTFGVRPVLAEVATNALACCAELWGETTLLEAPAWRGTR